MAGSRALRRFKPNRFKTRLTVAGETPVSRAIALPVRRWSRNAPIRAMTAFGGGGVSRLRPRDPGPQTGDAFDGITRHPFADGARTDACGSSGGLRRLSACHLHDDSLSTNRRQAGIVVDVHPVLLWNTEASQPQLPRSGPDGQPMESSHLERDEI